MKHREKSLALRTTDIGIDCNIYSDTKKPVGIDIADNAFQGSRVKVFLNSSGYELFNTLMSDSEFYD